MILSCCLIVQSLLSTMAVVTCQAVVRQTSNCKKSRNPANDKLVNAFTCLHLFLKNLLFEILALFNCGNEDR